MSGPSSAQTVIEAPTNGGLIGYTVYKGKKRICKDPLVWNDFRGQGSFIVCPDEPLNPEFPPLPITLPGYGVMQNYTVQDRFRKTVCKNPLSTRDQKNRPVIYCE